jgi:hypothetical protein
MGPCEPLDVPEGARRVKQYAKDGETDLELGRDREDTENDANKNPSTI